MEDGLSSRVDGNEENKIKQFETSTNAPFIKRTRCEPGVRAKVRFVQIGLM
jgi:hypothetical protein